MPDQPLSELEKRLQEQTLPGAPAKLRAAVLAGVDQELKTTTWDRRLSRAAVLLLVAGLGLNGFIGLSAEHREAMLAQQAPVPRRVSDITEMIALVTSPEQAAEIQQQLLSVHRRALQSSDKQSDRRRINQRIQEILTLSEEG